MIRDACATGTFTREIYFGFCTILCSIDALRGNCGINPTDSKRFDKRRFAWKQLKEMIPKFNRTHNDVKPPGSPLHFEETLLSARPHGLIPDISVSVLYRIVEHSKSYFIPFPGIWTTIATRPRSQNQYHRVVEPYFASPTTFNDKKPTLPSVGSDQSPWSQPTYTSTWQPSSTLSSVSMSFVPYLNLRQRPVVHHLRCGISHRVVAHPTTTDRCHPAIDARSVIRSSENSSLVRGAQERPGGLLKM